MSSSTIINKSQLAKLDFIDSLRGIAALSVIIFHLVYVPQPNLEIPSILEPFIRKGGSGVTLFFVISAFTLCLSTDNRQHETNKHKKFYLRRFFRIAPLFYFMLLVYLLREFLLYESLPSWKLILLNVSFTYNFYPPRVESIVWAGWTIGVEMIFYLILPLILIKVKNLQSSAVFIVFTLLLSSIYQYFAASYFDFSQEVLRKYLYMNIISQLPVFAIGISCYFIYRDYLPKLEKSNRLVSNLLFILFILLFLAVVVKVSFLNPAHYYLAFGFSALVLSLSLYSNKVLVNKFTCFYGEISYSAYLVHPFLINLLIPAYRYIYSQLPLSIFTKFFLCSVLTTLLVTLAAFLTYRLVEKPGIKLGKRFIASLQPSSSSRLV